MKGIPEEHEKRRSVFWELLNMDCRMVRPHHMIFGLLHDASILESFAWTTTLNTAGTC